MDDDDMGWDADINGLDGVGGGDGDDGDDDSSGAQADKLEDDDDGEGSEDGGNGSSSEGGDDWSAQVDKLQVDAGISTKQKKGRKSTQSAKKGSASKSAKKTPKITSYEMTRNANIARNKIEMDKLNAEWKKLGKEFEKAKKPKGDVLTRTSHRPLVLHAARFEVRQPQRHPQSQWPSNHPQINRSPAGNSTSDPNANRITSALSPAKKTSTAPNTDLPFPLRTLITHRVCKVLPVQL